MPTAPSKNRREVRNCLGQKGRVKYRIVPTRNKRKSMDRQKIFGGRGGVATCNWSTEEETEVFLAGRKDLLVASECSGRIKLGKTGGKGLEGRTAGRRWVGAVNCSDVRSRTGGRKSDRRACQTASGRCELADGRTGLAIGRADGRKDGRTAGRTSDGWWLGVGQIVRMDVHA